MSPPLLSFSSKALGPEAGFDAYHALYAGGSDVARTEHPFRAEVRAVRFNRMLVFERRLAGVRHGRDPARVRRDGFDHLTLHLLLSGSLIAGPEGDERRVRPGEIVIFDTSLPQRSRNEDTHTISVSLARDRIEPLVPGLRAFHGAILPAREAGVIADLLLSFTRRADGLAPEITDPFGSVLGILLAAALRGTQPGAEALAVARRTDRGRRRKAEAFIEAHLADPRLDADAVATGAGISRTVLYQCFSAEGGVARYIRQRRLEQVRNLLRRPGGGPTLAAVAHAYGFSSEQHLNRAFRATFGRPPGQFRSMIERLRQDSAGGPVHAFSDWHVELY